MQETARKKGFGINFCWGAKLLLWVYNHRWKNGSLTHGVKVLKYPPVRLFPTVPHASSRASPQRGTPFCVRLAPLQRRHAVHSPQHFANQIHRQIKTLHKQEPLQEKNPFSYALKTKKEEDSGRDNVKWCCVKFGQRYYVRLVPYKLPEIERASHERATQVCGSMPTNSEQ